jgi:hypothetical protein
VHASRSSNQIVKAKGFLKGKTLLDKNLTFWTMSLWASDAEMRAYRNTDAHKKAMPKLQRWCDEASIVHWLQMMMLNFPAGTNRTSACWPKEEAQK